MVSLEDATREMDRLEEDARRIVANPDLSTLERRLALERLLRQYSVFEEYKAALAAFVRRMRCRQSAEASAPEEAVREILDGVPEFRSVRLALLAAFIAATYGGGPRAAWVPLMLLPEMIAPTLGPHL